ncbi:MAG: alpha/beta hydrolase, partial [Oleiphilaceae bacterium]|nr:alpha/beta hydrolase [Oleiphilaceae bacterium]
MTWDRDSLLMELGKFSLKSRFKIKGAAAEYFRYYNSALYEEIDGLDQRIGWLETPDFRIVVQSFVPKDAKATVFVFHGYFDHAGIYQRLIRFLVQHDFAVVIYDMPGHGLSSGKPTSIDSFQQYQDAMDACLGACRGVLPEPFHAVGQSTGGAVLIDRMLSEGCDQQSFDKVVLLAPLIRPAAWQGVARLHSVVSPFLKVWHRTFSQNSSDVQFVKFLKENDPLQSKWLAV